MFSVLLTGTARRRVAVFLASGLIVIGVAKIGGSYVLSQPAKIVTLFQTQAGKPQVNGPSAPQSDALPAPASSLRGEECPPSLKASAYTSDLAKASSDKKVSADKPEGQSGNATRRPIAVMMPSDQVARPLSGIGFADIVIEMPVITGGINRIMAIFQCGSPSTIGSIRSARHDFIPLAAGYDAIFVHWGGSHYALDQLKLNVIDHVDALVNPFSAFWRKSFVRAPHNGFSSASNITRAAQGLNYRLITDFAGYPRVSSEGRSGKVGALRIYYPARVDYSYEPASGKYFRSRNNTKEVDALTQQQVSVDIVVVMFASSRQLEKDYNTVAVTGEGVALVFQKGVRQEARWRKDASKLSSPLEFLDQDGKQLPLARGAMWIQIVDPGTRVDWTVK